MNAQIISSLLIFAIGIGLGVLLQRYVLNRGTDIANLEKELDTLKGQQLQVNDSLQQHFMHTADLTQDLTNSYKALYEHLAGGASEFTQKPLADLKHVLEQATGDSLAFDAAKDYQPPKDYASDEEPFTRPEKEEETAKS
jgi:uncharacterized membrane-anchored protein YhcB (DUF1043 family)